MTGYQVVPGDQVDPEKKTQAEKVIQFCMLDLNIKLDFKWIRQCDIEAAEHKFDSPLYGFACREERTIYINHDVSHLQSMQRTIAHECRHVYQYGHRLHDVDIEADSRLYADEVMHLRWLWIIEPEEALNLTTKNLFCEKSQKEGKLCTQKK